MAKKMNSGLKAYNATRGMKTKATSIMSKSTVAKKAKKGKDFGKKNNGKTTGFNAVAAKASKAYGSPTAGKKVAGAMFQKMRTKGQL